MALPITSARPQGLGGGDAPEPEHIRIVLDLAGELRGRGSHNAEDRAPRNAV